MARQLTPRATAVVAWALSAAVFAGGCLPLSLATSGDYTWGFGIGLTACFWTLAVWNVRTLPRDSGTPAGRWLAALSALCLITGVVGVWSSDVGPGAVLVLMGGAGVFAWWHARRASRGDLPQPAPVPDSRRHERDASGPEPMEADRATVHRGRPRRLEWWVSGAWLLGLAAMIGFMVLSIAGDSDKGLAHPRVALTLAAVWLTSFATAWILQDRWAKTPPPR